jgi:phenolic acid decarboxylase
MEQIDRAEAIRGKTIRLTWTEGPTRGTTHEHVFHQDGTVEWRDAADAGKGSAAEERPAYAAVEVADGVYAVSYLAPSGYTLTVVLNFRDQKVFGFASSAKDWHPVRGKFEVVGAAGKA